MGSATQINQNYWEKLTQVCAIGAVYDSREREPHSKCFEGTRVELLQSLRNIVEESGPENKKMVWVSGESGSGKSTVAHTFADELRQQKKLAGSFFFSRKHTKRSTFDLVPLTLAYQLGLHHHRAREIITKAIADDPGLLTPEKSRQDQLEKLVIEPLKQLALTWGKTKGMALIFDALDEGTTRDSNTQHFRDFIATLSALLRNASLPICSIIIFSRAYPEIRVVMRSRYLSDITAFVQVQDKDSSADVKHYLQHELERIYDENLYEDELMDPDYPHCPSPSDVSLLSERANGRFIFAVTIIRL
ncbi:hypothetical protein CONPUDRAFT_66762, partial [Coniophora puteana RWD-64-598 SS2]